MQSNDVQLRKRYLQNKESFKCYPKCRYILLILAFFGISTTSILITSLRIVIIAMVDMTSETENELNGSLNNCQRQNTELIYHNNTDQEFTWNTAQQGLILGSCFYGSAVMQIPGAWLSQTLGPKKVIGVSMFLSAALTLLSPITARTSFELFVVLRIFLGVLQGAIYPGIIGIWNYWAPPAQRTLFLSVTLAGNSFGSVLTLSLIGYIAGTFGWHAAFYGTGSFAMLWTLCWVIFMYDTPNKHPWISEEEKLFINKSIGNRIQNKKKIKTPWCSTLTSIPMWAIMCAHFASNWGEYTIDSLLPIYMSTQLNFDITSIGIMIAFPYVLQVIVTMTVGYITDVIRKRKLTSTIAIRKINSSLGLLLPASFGLMAVYIGCNTAAVVTCFCFAISTFPFIVSGFKSSTADIAPRFGGITYAISNSFANIPGFLAPQVGGMILLSNNGTSQWQSIFWISAGLLTLGQTIFLIFGSAEEQPWANIDKTKEESVLTPLNNSQEQSPIKNSNIEIL